MPAKPRRARKPTHVADDPDPWAALYNLESGTERQSNDRPRMGRPPRPVPRRTFTVQLTNEEARAMLLMQNTLRASFTHEGHPVTISRGQVVGWALRLTFEKLGGGPKTGIQLPDSVRDWPTLAAWVRHMLMDQEATA
jgi:hypothetical protein